MRDLGIDIKAIKQVMRHEFASMDTVYRVFPIPCIVSIPAAALLGQLGDTATLGTTKTRKSQLKNKNNTILGDSMQNMKSKEFSPIFCSGSKKATKILRYDKQYYCSKTDKANLKSKYDVDLIKNNLYKL